jgi:hypothetical protein
MIPNNQIKADLVADIKTFSSITDLLASSSEVREQQYQGADYAYPAVRVAVRRNAAIHNREPCDHARLLFSIHCYTEEGSSMTADALAAAVNTQYHRRYFSGTGWYSFLRSAGLIPAARASEKLWRAEVLIEGTIYPTTAG